MYISVRKNETKRNGNVYYFYFCESKREDGKVKNQQKYLFKLPEGFLNHADTLIDTYCLWFSWCKPDVTEKIKSLAKVKAREIKEEVLKKIWDSWDEETKERFKNNSKDYNYNNGTNVSNSKNCNYNSEEKILFKQMYKDIAKIFHPDIAMDDGKKMQLLNKIKQSILM